VFGYPVPCYDIPEMLDKFKSDCRIVAVES
jgi:hypothetical protein